MTQKTTPRASRRIVAGLVVSALAFTACGSDTNDAEEPTPNVMEAVAGAVGEALANAGKHAQAERIVVYAEPDWDEGLFVSIKDDGIGFDPETVDKRIGLKESITARIEAIGGRVEISSNPGRGTEVRLWVP